MMLRGWLATAMLLVAHAAHGQDQTPWTTAWLPGTPKLLAEELGWRPSRLDRVRMARELVRVLHAGGAEAEAKVGRLDRILNLFDQLEEKLEQVASGDSIKVDLANRASRRDLEGLLDHLGYELQVSNGQPGIRVRRSEEAVERRGLFERAGLQLEAFVDSIKAGGVVRLEVPYFAVPLPLDAGTWSTALGQQGRPKLLVGRILHRRESALTYCGLLALDPGTLAFVGSRPKLLQRLSSNHSAALCAFGRSIHVVGGRVATPGGARNDALWKGLAAADSSDPEAFIEGLLSGDGGRVAWFFDFVTQAPAPTRNYVLSSWDPDDRRRHRRVLKAYNWFQGIQPAWDLSRQSFERPRNDPTIPILVWRVDAAGKPLGPTSRRFWSAAVRGDRVPESPVARDDDDLIDAGALVDLTRSESADSGLVQALSLGQAVALRDAAATPSAIGAVVRGYLEYPALIRTLEAMPSIRAETIALAVRQADVLTDPDRSSQPYSNLAQFQSLLAILDRAAAVGDTGVEPLVAALCRIPLGKDGAYDGALAAWFTNGLLPVVRERAATSSEPSQAGPDERVVRAWMSGFTVARATASLQWEGWQYSADPALPRYRNFSRVREQQRQLSVDTLVELYGHVAWLGPQTTPAKAIDTASTLRRIAALVGDGGRDVGETSHSLTIAEELADGAKRLSEARGRSAPSRYAAVRERLLPVLDRVATRVFRALAYAPYAGAPDGVLLIGGDIGPRHDLGIDEPAARGRPHRPWQVAEINSERGTDWHLRGSLLGLGHAVASLGLRESVDVAAPGSRGFDAVDQFGLIRTALAFAADDANWTSDLMSAAAAALSRGRAAVPTDAAETGRWEWRYHATPWVKANDPEAMHALYSVADLVSFGTNLEEWEGLATFGGELATLNGSWRSQLPPRMVLETWLGRERIGMQVVWAAELKLRLAELMNDLDLPGILAASLATRAAANILGAVAPVNSFDWSGVLHRVVTLSREEVSGLVATLTADGTLVAVQ